MDGSKVCCNLISAKPNYSNTKARYTLLHDPIDSHLSVIMNGDDCPSVILSSKL